MKKHLPTEFELQCTLMEWMALQYPKVLVRCDLGGIRLTPGLAKKAKKLNPHTRGWPDFMICEPRGKHHGLFVEFKKSRADLYTKKGDYKKGQHIEEQRAMLKALRQKGYSACFACGFETAKNVIDDYLDRRKQGG